MSALAPSARGVRASSDDFNRATSWGNASHLEMSQNIDHYFTINRNAIHSAMIPRNSKEHAIFDERCAKMAQVYIMQLPDVKYFRCHTKHLAAK
jgi:hypothetical protein